MLVQPPGQDGAWRHVDQVTGDGPAMLIRPDGYIAWVGTDRLDEAFRRWYRDGSAP